MDKSPKASCCPCSTISALTVSPYRSQLKAFHHFSGSFLQFSSMFTSTLNQEHRIEHSTPVVQLMRGEGSHPQSADDTVLFLMQPRRGHKDALLVCGLLGPFLKKVFSFLKRPFLKNFFPAVQSPTCANYSFPGVFFFFLEIAEVLLNGSTTFN